MTEGFKEEQKRILTSSKIQILKELKENLEKGDKNIKYAELYAKLVLECIRTFDFQKADFDFQLIDEEIKSKFGYPNGMAFLKKDKNGEYNGVAVIDLYFPTSKDFPFIPPWKRNVDMDKVNQLLQKEGIHIEQRLINREEHPYHILNTDRIEFDATLILDAIKDINQQYELLKNEYKDRESEIFEKFQNNKGYYREEILNRKIKKIMANKVYAAYIIELVFAFFETYDYVEDVFRYDLVDKKVISNFGNPRLFAYISDFNNQGFIELDYTSGSPYIRREGEPNWKENENYNIDIINDFLQEFGIRFQEIRNNQMLFSPKELDKITFDANILLEYRHQLLTGENKGAPNKNVVF